MSHAAPTPGERLPAARVWLNGAVVPEAEARIAPRDRGFLLGDGLFETLRSERGVPLFLDAHLDRLAATAALLGIAAPRSDVLAGAVRAVLDANGLGGDASGPARVRITASRGEAPGLWPSGAAGEAAPPTVLVTAEAAPPLPHAVAERGATAVWAKGVRVLAGAPALKSTSFQAYVRARREAAEAGAWEALLRNHLGEVAEGASSNVFAVLQGALVTPPVDAGVLPGVTRAAVLRLARRIGVEAREAPLRPQELERAEEAFLTSSVAGIVPLVEVEGAPIGRGADEPAPVPAPVPGPHTRRLQAAYVDEVAAQVAAVRAKRIV